MKKTTIPLSFSLPCMILYIIIFLLRYSPARPDLGLGMCSCLTGIEQDDLPLLFLTTAFHVL